MNSVDKEKMIEEIHSKVKECYEIIQYLEDAAEREDGVRNRYLEAINSIAMRKRTYQQIIQRIHKGDYDF